MVKRLQKQISIFDLAFGAKNLIFARNAVNTPPSLTDLNFLVRRVFTANTTVINKFCAIYQISSAQSALKNYPINKREVSICF